VGRRLLRALAWTLAALVAALAAGTAFVHAPWGASRLAGAVERFASAELDGDVAIGGLSVAPWGVRVRHVLIRDDRDLPVIAAEEVDAVLDPLALLVGRLHVRRLTVRDGRAEVSDDPPVDDVGIGQAFAPEHPSPAPPRPPRPGTSPLPPRAPVPIQLDLLRLEDVAFRLAELPGAPSDILVRDISGSAEGSWDRAARVKLHVTGRARMPLEAPVAVDLESTFTDEMLEAVAVSISAGGTSIRARGLGQMRKLDAAVQLEGVAGAAEARAFGIPLAADVDLATQFLLSRERLVGTFQAAVPGGGAAAGEAWLSPVDGTVHGRAVLEDVNPARWVPDAPDGSLSGGLAAAGDLTPAPRLDVELDLRRGTLVGEPFGPARLVAALDGDQVRIADGRVVLPGASATAVGTVAPGAVDLAATARARDLARTRRFLGLLGIDLPDLAGVATLRATAAGDPGRPRVTLRLASPGLRVGGVRAAGLDLAGAGGLGADGLPVFDGTGRADRLEAGRFRGTDVSLSARREEGGAFELRAGAAGGYALAAHGNLGRERTVVQGLDLRYPEGRLRLDAPATIETAPGRLAVRGLRLSGPGLVTGELALAPGRLDVDLDARALRLDRLPPALWPERLAGRVELRARVTGTPRRPEGQVRFRLEDGRYGALAGLAATGDARLAGGRAEGRIAVRLRDAGVVRGSFALPLEPATAPASAPFRLELASEGLALAALGAALGVDLPRATVRFRLDGAGTLGEPRLRLEGQALDLVLRGRGLPAADAALTLALDGGLATARFEGRAAGRPVLRLEGEAPFAPRRYLADPAGETRRLLRSSAVRVRAEARGLDLAFASRLLARPELSGPVAAVVDLRGPLLDPHGRIQVDVAARSLAGFQRVEGAVAVELGDRRLRLDGRVALDDGPASTFAAAVDAPLTALLDGTAPASTPVALSLDVPTLRLRRFAGGAATARAGERAAARPGGLQKPIPSPDQPRPGPRLTGTIEGHGHFEGTLARLRGDLRVSGRGLGVADVPLGDAELSVRQGDVLEARLDVIDPTAGTLTAIARLGAEVSPLALLRGGLPVLGRIPATLAVDGTALSIAPARLVDAVVAATGRASVVLRAEGPLGTLRPRGQLSVTGGRVELTTGQVLEGVELLARMEGDRLELANLAVRTPGRGSLTATGSLGLAPEPDTLALRAHAEDFPIGGPGGVTARVTGDVVAGGTFGGLADGLRVQVELPELRVAMPLRPPREVQPVARNRDVAIVTGPEALRRIRRSRIKQEERAIPVVVAVRAPDVRVTGEDVDARLAADLTLTRGPNAELVADGMVRSRRARVRVLGRTFDVERALARFEGPLERPYLEATARYQARDAIAWVDVVGPADAPQVRLRSEPPLPEAQIAVLIASGRLPEGGQPPPVGAGAAGTAVGEATPPPQGVEAGGAAASIAGSFLAGQLRRAIGPKLPLDVLALESGAEGGTRIEAGTFVGERLYLGYLRDLLPEPGQNLNEIRATYELSRSFSLESFYGDAATGGIDLVFERAVPSGPQRAARHEAATAGVPTVTPGRAPASFPGGAPVGPPTVGGGAGNTAVPEGPGPTGGSAVPEGPGPTGGGSSAGPEGPGPTGHGGGPPGDG
jgi:autotransporter translocation and assembly factor TamB